jgi:hypothetical protein
MNHFTLSTLAQSMVVATRALGSCVLSLVGKALAFNHGEKNLQAQQTKTMAKDKVQGFQCSV